MRAYRNERPRNVDYYWRNRDLEMQRVRVRQAGMVELLRDLRRVGDGRRDAVRPADRW